MGDGGKEQVVVALTKPERCYCMKRRGMLRNSDHTSMVSGSWCSLIIVTSVGYRILISQRDRLNENSHNIKIVFKIRLTVSKEMSQSFRTEVLKLWVTTHWWVVSRSWMGQ
ncbi:hypothetical protein T4C_10374, partial [Trichinella pseudospiralis]